MGAPDPRTEAAPPPAPSAAYDWEKAKQHWAFRPVQDPTPPRVASAEWNRSADRCVHQGQARREGLTPQPRAAKLALHPPRHLRPHRPAAHSRGNRRVPQGRVAQGVRKGRGPPARLASSMASNGAVTGSTSSATPIPPATMPISPCPPCIRYRNWVIAAFNATSRTISFCASKWPATFWPRKTTWHEGTRKSGSRRSSPPATWPTRAASARACQEFHLTIDDTIDNLGKGILGLTVGLRALPRSQIRPHPHRRLLRALRHLQEHQLPARRHGNLSAHLRLRRPQSRRGRRAEALRDAAFGTRQPHRGHEGRTGSSSRPTRKSAKPSRRIRTTCAASPRAIRTSRRLMRSTEGKPVNARIMVRGEPATLGPGSAARLPHHPRRPESARRRERQRTPGTGQLDRRRRRIP